MSNSRRRKNGATHAAQRAAQRYDVTLTRDDIVRLNRQVWAGKAIQFSKPRRNAARFFVESKPGQYLPALYSTKHHGLITILPPDAAEVVRAMKKFPHIQLATSGAAGVAWFRCQRCETDIGALGRLWQFLRLPVHRCPPARLQEIAASVD